LNLPYPRSLAVLAVLGLTLLFAVSDLRVQAWAGLLPVYEWMETTPIGAIGKTWGAAFAVVEAFHLVGMALLGGAVLFADGRLLGVWFKDVSQLTIEQQAHRVFMAGLWILLFTGVFMACAVAVKIYYLPVYWIKMLALAAGILFALCVRRPLLLGDSEGADPRLLRMVAVASIMVWFTVAACGRWIGFSG
jgi:hypothetical protein